LTTLPPTGSDYRTYNPKNLPATIERGDILQEGYLGSHSQKETFEFYKSFYRQMKKVALSVIKMVEALHKEFSLRRESLVEKTADQLEPL
jgi:hypothetical protein